MTDPGKPFEGIARRIDPAAELLRAWRLDGGVPAQVTALDPASLKRLHDGHQAFVDWVLDG